MKLQIWAFCFCVQIYVIYTERYLAEVNIWLKQFSENEWHLWRHAHFLLEEQNHLSCCVSGHMMTSSNENIFRVTGHLCGEFTSHRWIPRTKASDAGLWCFSMFCAWINDWVNNRDAGDLRRHCAHCDFTVMQVYKTHMTSYFVFGYSVLDAVHSCLLVRVAAQLMNPYLVP